MPQSPSAYRPHPRSSNRSALLGWCLLLTLFCPGRSHAQTGLEDLFIPVAIVAAPFVIVHDLLFGTDTGAFRSTDARSDKILKALPQPIPVQGLYIGPLHVRYGLQGMLVESQLPMVEIDAAGAAWLLALARDPAPLAALATQHPYIRLTIAPDHHPDCFAFKNTQDDITRFHPVRPGHCMRAAFVDTLQSDLALRVDASRVAHRELSWELLVRASGKLLLRLPFWEYQHKGYPLSVSGTYRTAGETFTFARLIQALQPVDALGRAQKAAGIMTRIDYAARRDTPSTSTEVAGYFRAIPPERVAMPWRVANESWPDGYARAYATGMPVILNNSIIILPKTDRVGPACVFARRDCSFADTFISGDVIMTTTAASVWNTPAMDDISPSVGIGVTGRYLDGRLAFDIFIVPATLSAASIGCDAGALTCSFRPDAIERNADQLVVRGRFLVGRKGGAQTAQSYALYVPALAIPGDRQMPVGAHNTLGIPSVDAGSDARRRAD
jgi:hypothetical protein